MTDRHITLLGEPADLALAGPEHATRPRGGLTLELVRGVPASDGAWAWDAVTATIAGEQGVWRRLPWPAGARALGLPAPTAARGALVAGPEELAVPIADRLRERGLAVEVCERADLDAIAAASVVCLPVPHGAPPPAEAMAVMAAARLLVTGVCEPGFGLQRGIDCWMEATADGAAQRAEAALRWPEAFEVPRALARVAAARQRAEIVLHRLAIDAVLRVGSAARARA